MITPVLAGMCRHHIIGSNEATRAGAGVQALA